MHRSQWRKPPVIRTQTKCDVLHADRWDTGATVSFREDTGQRGLSSKAILLEKVSHTVLAGGHKPKGVDPPINTDYHLNFHGSGGHNMGRHVCCPWRVPCCPMSSHLLLPDGVDSGDLYLPQSIQQKGSWLRDICKVPTYFDIGAPLRSSSGARGRPGEWVRDALEFPLPDGVRLLPQRERSSEMVLCLLIDKFGAACQGLHRGVIETFRGRCYQGVEDRISLLRDEHSWRHVSGVHSSVPICARLGA